MSLAGPMSLRAGRLFGRHVAGGAQDRAGARLVRVGLHLLGQAEVGDLGLIVLVEQDVGRLQIAMDDAACVGVMDGARRSASR